MYVVLYGSSSFPIVQACYCKTLREMHRQYNLLRGQYTYCVYRIYR